MTAYDDQRSAFIDPARLRGMTAAEIDGMMPSGWMRESARTDGTRYVNPTRRGEQVRVMAGNPNDPEPAKRGPYARVSSGGVTSPPIPLQVNPTL